MTREDVDRYDELLGVQRGVNVLVRLNDGMIFTRRFERIVWRNGQPLVLVVDGGFIPWGEIAVVATDVEASWLEKKGT